MRVLNCLENGTIAIDLTEIGSKLRDIPYLSTGLVIFNLRTISPLSVCINEPFR